MKRLLVLTGILMIVALAGGYLFFARESVYRVTGPSMAPALVGPHYNVTCPDCGHFFPIDATRGPIPTATCDFCGAIAPVKTGDVRAGDALDMISGEIGRFDLIMFSDPEDTLQRVVKRVVGMPGETIECRDGDLWIDGQRYEKSWDEFARVAIPVFESNGELAAPQLQKSPDGWITYHHQVHSQGIQLSGAAAPLDDYPYNQGRSGKLQPITDIGLICEWVIDLPQLELALLHRDGMLAKRLIREDTRPNGLRSLPVQDYPNGKVPLLPPEAAFESATRQLTVRLAACDGRLVTKWDDSLESIDPLAGLMPELTATPFQFRSGGSGSFHRLKIVRDIQYADFPETKIPADAYFVLGDNVLASRDSRHFGPIAAKNARRVAPASKPD